MLKIIAIGKNAQFLKDAENEYVSRINHFAKIEVLEIKEDKSKHSKEVMKKEAEKIKAALKGAEYIVLDMVGENTTTEQFTAILKDNKDMVFVIGGAFGLDEAIKKGAKKRISLSKMTFTHQIARVLLLEQIYRAQTIMNGRKYHK
ncbi:MAG: 23S rRNA (pseudouridine(1915)-N(3))-methyltransferase RlmH [Candidatus Aenigmarchaeota archaeon]|nr:23S rRNA (pseudouridine(1915)-N(3))-methyltransferase RlmH [Candidatus Aenigmarchaeota archaeon]